MITIEITEEVKSYSELENLLEEVLRRVQNGTRISYDPDFEIKGDENFDEDETSDEDQEILKFTLTNDPETYYTISQEYMNDYAEDEGKEVENWGIAVNGLPPATVAIATNIYIDYGIRAAQ